MDKSQSLPESIDGPSESGQLPDSPFLVGTKVQYAWDSTSLGYLKRCPRLYYYQMIQGWQPKEDNVHLRFGIEYHEALHRYEVLRSESLEGNQDHNDALHGTVK